MWGLDATRHGVGPRQRRGEAREGDHPGFCRALLGAAENRGYPRFGRRPCPEAAGCAVGFADRGSLKSGGSGEAENTRGDPNHSASVMAEEAVTRAF